MDLYNKDKDSGLVAGPNFGYLYYLDNKGWDGLDGKIARAADGVMKSVDAETVALFRKYDVHMPYDFAHDSRWIKEEKKDFAPPAIPKPDSDEVKYRKAYYAQTVRERAEINQAILNTDARRIGMTPREYYKVREKATTT